MVTPPLPPSSLLLILHSQVLGASGRTIWRYREQVAERFGGFGSKWPSDLKQVVELFEGVRSKWPNDVEVSGASDRTIRRFREQVVKRGVGVGVR